MENPHRQPDAAAGQHLRFLAVVADGDLDLVPHALHLLYRTGKGMWVKINPLQIFL